ncbi:TPA: hypothetical protein N3A33_001092 [Salmonella enterica subsp. salamae serovar 28:r:e,n,z15]|nr:hypothetical protein [Salmonella enterica subsp. salamae serovar 28:r:e,n,z15]
MANNQQKLNSDWDLTAMARLLKEKNRLDISNARMAKMLGLEPYFYSLVSDEKPDFKVYELPGEVLAALDSAGVDLFYVMTGEYSGDNYEIMLEAFDYAIADLSLEKQDDMRELVQPIYEKLMNNVSAGKDYV